MTTEYELAQQYGPNIAVAEIHWKINAGTIDEEFQYNTGVITCNHPSSSRGLPVFLAGSNSHTVPDRQLIPGQVYGPADLPIGYQMLWIRGHRLCAPNYEAEFRLARAAKSAGYAIDEAEEIDHV